MEELEPLRMDDAGGAPLGRLGARRRARESRMPGAPSRWTGKKDLSWVPLRPERVCEVAYDHMEGDRFRHTAQFRRWRPDRDAARAAPTPSWRSRCGYDLSRMLTESATDTG